MSKKCLDRAVHGAMTFSSGWQQAVVDGLEQWMNRIPRAKELELSRSRNYRSPLLRHFEKPQMEELRDLGDFYWLQPELLTELTMDELVLLHRYLRPR